MPVHSATKASAPIATATRPREQDHRIRRSSARGPLGTFSWAIRIRARRLPGDPASLRWGFERMSPDPFWVRWPDQLARCGEHRPRRFSKPSGSLEQTGSERGALPAPAGIGNPVQLPPDPAPALRTSVLSYCTMAVRRNQRRLNVAYYALESRTRNSPGPRTTGRNARATSGTPPGSLRGLSPCLRPIPDGLRPSGSVHEVVRPDNWSRDARVAGTPDGRNCQVRRGLCRLPSRSDARRTSRATTATWPGGFVEVFGAEAALLARPGPAPGSSAGRSLRRLRRAFPAVCNGL